MSQPHHATPHHPPTQGRPRDARDPGPLRLRLLHLLHLLRPAPQGTSVHFTRTLWTGARGVWINVAGRLLTYIRIAIYTHPSPPKPQQLKQSGWIGNYALGCSYISLPWWCGQAMFGTLNAQVVVLTILYRCVLGVGV